MFSRTDRPTVPGRLLAPITATDAGWNTGRRLATLAARSRAATVSRYASNCSPSSSGGSGMVIVTTPSSRLVVTGRPASEKTRSMPMFSVSVSATNVSTCRARASETRCSSSRVAMPRWCMVSATANAISAVLPPLSRSTS